MLLLTSFVSLTRIRVLFYISRGERIVPVSHKFSLHLFGGHDMCFEISLVIDVLQYPGSWVWEFSGELDSHVSFCLTYITSQCLTFLYEGDMEEERISVGLQKSMMQVSKRYNALKEYFYFIWYPAAILEHRLAICFFFLDHMVCILGFEGHRISITRKLSF